MYIFMSCMSLGADLDSRGFSTSVHIHLKLGPSLETRLQGGEKHPLTGEYCLC